MKEFTGRMHKHHEALDKIIAKTVLFEFNDEATREKFSDEVRDILLTDDDITTFKVVCDETNNPETVIENNELVADIYLKYIDNEPYHVLNIIVSRNKIEYNDIIQNTE